MFTVLCSTGILIQDQDHSLDRSQSCYQVVANTCWARLMKTNRLVVKMLQVGSSIGKYLQSLFRFAIVIPVQEITYVANKLESLHISVAVTISRFDLSVMYPNISQSQVLYIPVCVYSIYCLYVVITIV